MQKFLFATGTAVNLLLAALTTSSFISVSDPTADTTAIEQTVQVPSLAKKPAVVQPTRYIGDPNEVKGWSAVYFRPHEFASKGNGLIDISAELVDRLDAVRAEFGQPIRITSGYRDPAHNERVGGAENSQHIHGIAVDIDLTGMDETTRYRLMVLLIQHGFTSFGSYDRSPNMLHADLRDQAVTWDHGDGIHPVWFDRALKDTGWKRGLRAPKPVSPENTASLNFSLEEGTLGTDMTVSAGDNWSLTASGSYDFDIDQYQVGGGITFKDESMSLSLGGAVGPKGDLGVHGVFSIDF